MLQTTKNINPHIERVPVICGLLLAAMFTLLPATAKAQCWSWNASGQRHVYQPRQEKAILLTLEQQGKFLVGTASTQFDGRTVRVPVRGTIEGDNFSIEIEWSGSLTGVYNGRVLPSGKIHGGTYDKNNPNIQAAWRTEVPLKCLPAPAPVITKPPAKEPATPAPKVLRATGRKPKAEPPPSMKVPGIVVSQAIFPGPYQPAGFVILTWDAGPEHPFAEVWFKINGSDDNFLVEGGKGGRQVPVERGRFYVYTLTDAGKTLATVSFAPQ